MKETLLTNIRAACSALNRFVAWLPRALKPAGLRAARSTPILLALVLTLTGCTPHHYEVVLSKDEAAGAGTECLFTDASPAGHVYKVLAGPDASRIALIAVNDTAALRFRAGIIRLRSDGKIVFDTSRCRPDSPPLAVGERIPTETKAENVIKNLAARQEAYWVVAALALGGLLFALCRRLRIALILVLLGVALFLLCATRGFAQPSAAPAGQTGVLFTRDFLRQEQSTVRQKITQVEQSNDTVARLLDGRLFRDAGEELVRGLCRLDSADLLLQGEPARISQLKGSALVYSKTDEQSRLTAAYEVLRQQLQNAQQRAATLQQRCMTNEQDTLSLQIFLTRRESFRARASAVDKDPTAILEECRRLAAADKAEADLARLRQQMDKQLAQLRRVTNEVRTVIEKLVPAPPLPPVKVVEYVTNRVFLDRTNVLVITNAPLVAAALSVLAGDSTKNTNIAVAAATNATTIAVTASNNTFGSATTVLETEPVSTDMSHGVFHRPLFPAIAVLILALLGLGGFSVYLNSIRGHPFAIRLQTATQTQDFEVAALEQGLVLRDSPTVEDLHDINGSPCIVATLLGARLRASQPGKVMINNLPITKTCRLKPGDQISISSVSQKQPLNFQFLNCASLVPTQLESLEDTQTNIQ